MVRPLIAKKRNTLVVECEPGLGPMHNDPTKLRQVLFNLLGNALKYTSAGQICLRARTEPLVVPGQSETVMLRVQVQDTGMGFAPELAEAIFQPFVQADNSITRAHNGAGLGLAISRKLVELMGGKIWLESQPEIGSRFSFTLPLEAITTVQPMLTPEMSDGPLPAEAGAVILVVEDEPFSRKLMFETLQGCGYQVETAEHGAAAIELLGRRPVDLVLMDIQLPVMSGAEVTRRIRAGEVPGCRRGVPIIALTAFALSGDRERFLSLGIDEYLPKPIKIDTVLETVARFLNHKTSAGS